jgi:hypothetical protein
MISILKISNGMTMSICVAFFLSACGGTGVSIVNDNGDSGAFSLTTPYINESEMASINEAFSADDSAPWRYAHGGIDIFPMGNLKPFQTACAGIVDDVKLWQNNITSNWQVNVRIVCNDTYSIMYIFEPMSAERANGEIQLANIFVSKEQPLIQGALIGFLLTSGEGSHVDFSLFRDRDATCPEPFFSQEARESILRLIHVTWPGAGMCY